MRYKDTGNLHKDFHLSTDATIKYVLKEHGERFLRELFRRTAQNVYKDIYESLKSGDCGPLLEHWDYYFKREGADFDIAKDAGGAVLVVRSCPAVRHLEARGVKPEPCFCLQTSLMNEAWSEGTPFEIKTEICGTGSCKQTVRRR